MQADGHMAAVGAIYAPYLDGAGTYAVSTLNPEQQKPWQEVTYLGIRRAPGWHKWTFDFDPDKGMRLLYDDQAVENFNWKQSKLKGFASVVLFGDATDAKQTLWVDDATVTLGRVARYTGLQVYNRPHAPLLLAGSLVMLFGLAWHFYHRHRDRRRAGLED